MAIAQKKSGLIATKLGNLQAVSIFLISALYAGLVLGSGVDRLAASRPEIAHRVPSLFASEALLVRGAQAIVDGKTNSTIEFGMRALRDAPTDPQSAAMLGAGLLANGDQTKADRAFRVAGRLGWRVPITQSYWLGKALSVSDYELAALRLDALLRQQPNLLSQRQLLDPLERNPTGRAALIRRMALKPEWLPVYASNVTSSPADVMLQRSEVLEEAARKGLVLGCDTIAPTVARLVELKLHDEAARLSRAHCPSKERTPVAAPTRGS